MRSIEEHFENPATYETRGACEDNCTYCTDKHIEISGRISRIHLIGVLLTKIFGKGDVPATKLVTLITDKKGSHKIRSDIWGKGVNVDLGKVHGLVLMLLAAGMIELSIPPVLVGKKGVKPNQVRVILATRIIKTPEGDCENLAMGTVSFALKVNINLMIIIM